MTYTIAQCYSRGSTPFGASGPYYTPGVGHRGKDYDHNARETIVAYKEMVIEVVGKTSVLGLVIGARFTDGSGYCGFAHLVNIQSFINGLVPAGAAFAEAATWGDYHGSAWTGAHIHTTVSSVSSYAAAYGVTPGLRDPAPIIAAAIAGYAQSGLAPVPVPKVRYRKRDRMFTLAFTVPGGTGYLQGPKRRKAFPSMYHYLLLKRDLYGRLNPDGSIRDGEPDTFTEGELNIIAEYKAAVS